MATLLNHLASWKPFTALVVGDFMLDQTVFGDADRLTNDAPVPVLNVSRTEQMPGGAANVCADLAAMHGRVLALGVTGNDDAGRTLRDLLHRAGIDPSGLLIDPTRPTTQKKSLVGLAQHRHAQKMFRIDHESREPVSPALAAALLDEFDRVIDRVDVVAIEDYDKGVCTEAVCRGVIERARARGKPVLVDPARLRDYSRYRGADAVTPNRTEAEVAAGIRCDDSGSAQHNAALARTLQQKYEFGAVVLTLDKHGALLLERGGEPLAIPTVARQVYDVTGAGDMVLAALCAARANGIGWPDAVRFANAAAGLEVEVIGVQPIPFERIYQSVLSRARAHVGKARSLDEAMIEVAAARREGRGVVFTNGCFDVLHAGHIRLLRRAAEQGDMLIVAINSDDSVRRLKGEGRPVHTAEDRAYVLSELESVSVVVVFDEDTPVNLLKALRPDVLVKGADYTLDRVVGRDIVEAYGGRVELVDFLEGRSTSEAIRKMRNSPA